MEQYRRIRILRTIAQAIGAPTPDPTDPVEEPAPASAPGTTTTTVPSTTTTTTTTPGTTTPSAIKIDLQTIPTYRSQLFSLRPDLIVDISKIVNIVNDYLQALSQNNVNFTATWKQPSLTGAEFSNSLKNLYNLSKWLYSVLTAKTPVSYSIEGLKQIATNLMTMIRSYSFPEPAAVRAQADIITAAQAILTKLG